MGRITLTRQLCLGTARKGLVMRRHIFSKAAGRTSNGSSIISTVKSELVNKTLRLLFLGVVTTSPHHIRKSFPSTKSSPTSVSEVLALDPKWKWLRTAGVVAPAAFRNLFFLFLLSSALLPTPVPISPSFSYTQAMASYAYSTSASDLSTPRSSSPSSAASGRSSHSSISQRMSISSRRISASNPLSTVNVATIAEQLKMANLNTLRGYAQNHYGEVKQGPHTQYVPQNQAAGYQVLREPLWNRGMSRSRHPILITTPPKLLGLSKVNGSAQPWPFAIFDSHTVRS